jgi:hypothetical protein
MTALPEKNLLASFSDLQAAKHCQDALRDEGFDVVEVDSISPAGDQDPLPHAPAMQWGRYGYQPRRLDDKWTSPSSWLNSSTGLIEGSHWLLTAVVPAEDAEHVAHVIHQYGGSL